MSDDKNTKDNLDKAKEVMDNVTEKASELAGEVSEHLVDMVEDVKEKVEEIVSDENVQKAKDEIKETKTKTKSFFQRLFGK